MSHGVSLKLTQLLTFNPEVLHQFLCKSSSTSVPNQSVAVKGNATETSHSLELWLSIPQRLCPCCAVPLHSLMLTCDCRRVQVYNSPLIIYNSSIQNPWQVLKHCILYLDDGGHMLCPSPGEIASCEIYHPDTCRIFNTLTND